MLIALALFDSVSASPALRNELAQVCDQVATILSARNTSTISLGTFQGPAKLLSSGGSGIAQLLEEELKARRITVGERAEYTLRGKFFTLDLNSNGPFPAARSERPIAVRVTLMMVDQLGTPLAEFVAVGSNEPTADTAAITLQDEDALVTIIGLTGTLPATASPKQRNQQIRQQIESGELAGDIRGNAVFADVQSPFGMEILVAGDARIMTRVDGAAFVSLERGDRYAIRLVNNANFDAAVTLSIDGISTFAFADLPADDRSASQLHYLVPARGSLVVPGWFETLRQTREFTVTSVPESAAARFNLTTEIGTITASFRASWPSTGQPPDDEPAGVKGNNASGNATGLGRVLPQRAVIESRNIGVLRAAVSARYVRQLE